MPELSRRHLLVLTAAALPALAIGCNGGFEPEAVPESTTRFPRTLIAGDMTHTRVVLTVYVADNTAVTLRMWTDDEVVVDRALEPTPDGFHKVMIDALTPGTTYQYAAFGGDAPGFDDRSLIGTVQTAPADDTLQVVRVGLLCCIGSGTIIPDYYYPEVMGEETATPAPFQWELFQNNRDVEFDMLVHLGDQGYLDFVWSQEDGTREAYLRAWGFYHGGGYRDIYPKAGLYATWDDHESTDNGKFDPWDMSDEDAAKLANAQSAWYTVVPIDAETRADAPVWRGFRWGATLELLLLDCRYELDGEHLMSEAQLAWLVESIENSPCRFVCVATPKPFSKITSSTELRDDNVERWETFVDDRQRVTDLLDSIDGKHVIFVTGDIHMNYLGRVTESGEAVSDKVWELCVTSGNQSPIADTLSDIQFDFVDNNPHLPVLTFDPNAETIHVAFYAADGSLAFEKTLDDV